MLNLALQLDGDEFNLLFKFLFVIFKLNILVFKDLKLVRRVGNAMTLSLDPGFGCMIIIVRFLMI
jgi:hypothetical protein